MRERTSAYTRAQPIFNGEVRDLARLSLSRMRAEIVSDGWHAHTPSSCPPPPHHHAYIVIITIIIIRPRPRRRARARVVTCAGVLSCVCVVLAYPHVCVYVCLRNAWSRAPGRGRQKRQMSEQQRLGGGPARGGVTHCLGTPACTGCTTSEPLPWRPQGSACCTSCSSCRSCGATSRALSATRLTSSTTRRTRSA